MKCLVHDCNDSGLTYTEAGTVYSAYCLPHGIVHALRRVHQRGTDFGMFSVPDPESAQDLYRALHWAAHLVDLWLHKYEPATLIEPSC